MNGLRFLYHWYIRISECSKGYFGESCDKPCPPGSFGFMCGGKCFPKCSKEACNHVSGCPNNIGYTSSQIHTGIYKHTFVDFISLLGHRSSGALSARPSVQDLLFGACMLSPWPDLAYSFTECLWVKNCSESEPCFYFRG